MTTIAETEWTFLTPLVNEIKPVQTFVADLLFGNHETVPTETIEIGTLRGDRSMAPFITKDAEALMVPGLATDAIQISAPTIRIKKPFTPSPLLFNRQHDSVIELQGSETQVSAVQRHIARDSARMVDLVQNAEEYLACLALTGTIAYTNEVDGVAFQIQFAKDSGNTVTLTGADLWTAGTSFPKIDVLHAKRQLADLVGLQPTDAIMGTEASEAFLKNTSVLADLDNRRLVAGEQDITTQFSDQGAIFLGRYGGVRWWEYGRQMNVPGLGLTSLINPKMVHFVTASPAAEQVMYFGAIRDMEAFQAGVLKAERFSKSWMEHDPSVMVQLIESHPLPCFRRPNSVYSVQVVA